MIETRKNFDVAHREPPREILREFVVPPYTWDELSRPTLRPEAGIFPKPDVSLVIGRFQPLHWGHMYLIRQALEISNSVIIGIGSSNIINEKNPFSAKFRHVRLSEELMGAGLSSRIKKIVHLQDHDDDDIWLRNAQKVTGFVDNVVGNNSWVNGIFQNAGIETIEIEMRDRKETSGAFFRGVLREKGFLGPIPHVA